MTNGARLATYVIHGEPGSGVIGINGAAAHLVKPGDLVIIASYAQMTTEEARDFQPRICFVDGQNAPPLACGAWPSPHASRSARTARRTSST